MCYDFPPRHPPLPARELRHHLHNFPRFRGPAYALALFAYLAEIGQERIFRNSLVFMMVESVSTDDACSVFHQIPGTIPDSLVMGYAGSRKPLEALDLYERMWEHGFVFCHSDHGRIFVSLLKACAQLKDIRKGIIIHVNIQMLGFLDHDVFVGSALIDMYAKCGSVSHAQQVFNNLPVRNTVSWTSLISGYIHHGCCSKAIALYNDMVRKGVLPNEVTYLCILKACGSMGGLVLGESIHNEIQAQGFLTRNVALGNALIDMYARCDVLVKSKDVFENLEERDVVSWTTLISSYVEHGYAEEALKLYEEMQIEGVFVNAVTYVCVLKACSVVGNLRKGEILHAQIQREKRNRHDIVLGNALIDMYAKCGNLTKAQEVFHATKVPNIITWTALIAGYAEYGDYINALHYFEQMQLKGMSPNVVTFVCVLKTCSSLQDVDKGRELHAEIERQSLIEKDMIVGNALVDMYAKCGLLSMSQEVFEKIPTRNVVSWNAIITGCVEYGYVEEAVDQYEQMRHEGFYADSITFASTLKACSIMKDFDTAQKIHAAAESQGLVQTDVVVGSAIVDMYVKCGSLAEALKVFDKLPMKNVVSWTAVIVGYADHGYSEKALEYFEKMRLEDISPDGATLVSILKVCGILGNIDKGQEIQSEIERHEHTRGDPAIGSALIEMYTKCGLFGRAREVFNNLSVRDVVVWSTLIEGYAENEQSDEALELYERMEDVHIPPNAITFVSALKACGSIGAIGKGQEIHGSIERRGLLEGDIVVGNTLVDMYVKCGLLSIAQRVFERLCDRDVVSWTVLMAGYAQQGQSENAFDLFDRMVGEGTLPNMVTFIVLLSACNRRGLYNTSQSYFEAMRKDYGILPSQKHHNCVVDLLGKAGRLEEALTTLQETPFGSNLVTCHAILSACRKWGEINLARQTFEYALQLDRTDSVAYVLMSHVYADAKSSDKATKHWGKVPRVHGNALS